MRSVLDRGQWIDSCSQCSDLTRTSTFHDVYFRQPYWEQHIGPGPIFVRSREHKAMLLKQHGLREAGDRVHGSNGFDAISHKFAQKSLKEK